MIPASVLLGIGNNGFWTIGRVYISDLGEQYAKLTGADKDKIIARIFGVYYACISVSVLLGNCVSSAVMNSFASSTKETGVWNNSRNEMNDIILSCGVHNCDCNNKTLNLNSQYNDLIDRRSQVDKAVLIALFTGFAFAQVVAAIIMKSCVVDEKPEHEPLISKHTSHGEECKTQNAESTIHRIRRNMIATAKLHADSLNAKLLIPLAIHGGLLKGFIMSQITRDWITCYYGKYTRVQFIPANKEVKP